MFAQVGILRDILPRQPVGVLVRAALPEAVRIAEVDAQSGVDCQLGVRNIARRLGRSGSTISRELPLPIVCQLALV